MGVFQRGGVFQPNVFQNGVTTTAPSNSIGSTIVSQVSRQRYREIRRRYEKECELELQRLAALTPLERAELELKCAKEARAEYAEHVQAEPDKGHWRARFEQADVVVAELAAKVAGIKARQAAERAKTEAAAARAEEAARAALVRDAEASRKLHRTITATASVLDRVSATLAVDRAAIAEQAYWTARAKARADQDDEEKVLHLLLDLH